MTPKDKSVLTNPAHPPNHSSLTDLLTASLEKAVLITLLAPFNFIENRFQVMAEMKRNGLIKELYKSYSHCITTAVKEENGIRTLWKGNLAKVLLGWSGLLFSLTAGDYGKRQIGKLYRSSSPDRMQYLKYFGNLAGMISSLGSIILTYPLEYAYIRLLADKQSLVKEGNKQFKNIREAMLLTLKEDGVRGLYRGVFTSFGAIALYRVSYFGLYDLWKSVSDAKMSLFQTFLASYVITLSSSAIAYPANTIRKRMMMRSLERQKYSWWFDCFRQVVRNQGFLALYRGFPMALITAISNSLVMISYQKMMGQINLGRPSIV